ncbi:matrixin family metalloprotease [Phormidium tenue FACHB-886]|nr:matrixin family metalloprotease [Phormidium tenue FACHB-886]
MVADGAGNSIRKARQIDLSTGPTTINDRIGSADSNDYYVLQLKSRSSFAAKLGRLKADAQLALFNQRGRILQQSTRKGKRAESVQQTLKAGTYYLRVYSGNRRANTQYKLTLAASAVSSLPAQPNPASSRSSFNIQFDYRFDTSGWFTPEKKAALEAAANVWERIILNEFPDLPAGSRATVVDPQTRLLTEVVTDKVDDLVIFMGARQRGGSFSTLAVTQPASWLAEQSRSDFAPWVGNITFTSEIDWFFDSTPETAADVPRNRIDFISVAAHEIGHVLGISRSKAFDDLEVNYSFQGAKAKAQNGGNPVQLTNTLHIDDDTQSDNSGDPLLSPFHIPGERKLPTALDIAILEDTGYTVDYSTASRNPVA